MNEREFKEKTQDLALRIIRLVDALPKKPAADVVGRQLLRSGTSVGANYRAACRARSGADMLNKLAIVEEEADETLYWLELLVRADLVPERKIAKLLHDMDSVLSMIVASVKTLRQKENGSSNLKSRIQNPKSEASRLR